MYLSLRAQCCLAFGVMRGELLLSNPERRCSEWEVMRESPVSCWRRGRISTGSQVSTPWVAREDHRWNGSTALQALTSPLALVSEDGGVICRNELLNCSIGPVALILLQPNEQNNLEDFRILPYWTFILFLELSLVSDDSIRLSSQVSNVHLWLWTEYCDIIEKLWCQTKYLLDNHWCTAA